MKIAKQIHNMVDKFVVLNESQSKMLIRYYNIDKNKIEIIPNIINENFYLAVNDSLAVKDLAFNNYVLCTGNISSRKNQLNLAKAVTELNLSLLLIGNILEGEEAYAKELQLLINKNKNIIWKTEIQEGSNELVNYYINCKIFALPSYEETQPISALEAICLNKPILLQHKEYAKQKYFNCAYLCKDGSVASIKEGLLKFLKDENTLLPNLHIEECRQESVAYKYKELYDSLLIEE